MANPLITLGPGGDYTARYFVKGISLAKQVGTTFGQQPDTETDGSYAGYSQWGKRRKAAADQADQDIYSDAGQVTIDGDAYEPSQPVASATYGKGGAVTGAAGVRMSAETAAAAAEAWLAAQQRTLIAIPLYTPAQVAGTGQQGSRIAPRRMLRPVNLASRPIPLLASTEQPGSAAHSASPMAYRTAAAAWPRILAIVPPPAAPASAAADWHDEPQLPESPLTASETDHEPHAQTVAHSHPHSRPASGTGLLADHAGAGRRTGRQQGDRLRARRSAHQKGSALARSQQGSLFNG